LFTEREIFRVYQCQEELGSGFTASAPVLDVSAPLKLLCIIFPQGGVDTFNQMCSYQSCHCMTKKWPLTFLWDFECSRGQFLYSV